MTLSPATKLDGYEILGPLGAGGMGEVYRAREPALKREVAIKVLPAYFSQDPDRLRRFEQEAQAAAALNHPNILAIHRFGTFEGAPYLVSELLEGDTLGRLLASGSLPVRKAIDYGVQIAGGLAAAHEKGIVHRDLKPENIFVSKDGRAKILDFGLAKLTQATPTTQDAPTITLHEQTDEGHVLGTVGYMSPEQVRGKPVDHRADIFAFGAILYEMLTGKRAFKKPTSTETMTAILNEDPPQISQIKPSTPPAMQRIVHRCLEKNPEQRFQSASDLAFALQALSDSGKVAEDGSDSGLQAPDLKPAKPWWKRKATIAVAACIVVASFLYPLIAPQIQSYWRLRELQQLKVVPLTTLPGFISSPTFSPDGSQIAFAWWNGDPTQPHDLYVKVIGTDMPVRLTHEPFGISGAAWSPDGKYIAICRRRGAGEDGEVFLISPLGGPERRVSTANCGQQWFGNLLSWSPDGKRLAFPYHPANSPAQNSFRLFVLSLESLEGAAVKSDCDAVMRPAFSPLGDYLAWACIEKTDAVSIYQQRISDGTITPLVKGLDGLGGLAWAGDGRRIFYSDSFTGGNLWEVALERPDQPVKLPFGNDVVDIAASPAGKRLAIRELHFNTNIWRVDLSQPQAPAQKVVASTRQQTAGKYSPDATQIAFESNRSGSNDEVWVSDADGSNAVQLSSFGAFGTGTPRWSPDGKLIAFDSRVDGEANIYLVDPHGGVPKKLNVDIRGNNLPSWSHDGKWIYFVNGEDAHHSTVWKVPAEGGHATQLAQLPATFPVESPDAQHVYFIREDQLWSVKTDGSDAQQIPAFPPSARDAWVPFGSGIYFWNYTNNKPVINFLDLNTKKVRSVFFPEKNGPDWMGGLSVSPDGRWLLFSQVDEASSNLMLVENWR